MDAVADPITSAIEGAMQDALPDTEGDDGGGGESPAETQDSAAEAPSSPETPDASQATGATPDPIDELLAAADFKFAPPVPGQREPRVPQSRLKKIVAKAVKQLEDKHATALKEHTEKVTGYEGRLAQFDKLDRLATENPERYIHLLAAHDPRYQAFLRPAAPAEPEKAATKPAEPDEPMPEPNAKFADGSKGYDIDGVKSLVMWARSQATREAQKVAQTQVDLALKKQREELQPILSERQARERYARELPKIKADIADARETWGDAFDKHVDEIDAAIKADTARARAEGRPPTAFDRVVARVLLPKVRADRTAMRKEIHDELNQRRPAATTPAAQTQTVETGEKSLESVIKQQMAAAGLS